MQASENGFGDKELVYYTVDNQANPLAYLPIYCVVLPNINGTVHQINNEV